MNPLTLRTSCLLAAGAILMTGCSEQSGIAGALGGIAGSVAGIDSGQSVATRMATGAAIGAATYIIAKHVATESQRRTAEKNAKIYYAQLPPEKKADLKKKKVRYILVPTVKSAETSPKAKEVRMTWDTQSESLADKYAYEIENPPAAGTVATVGGHTAEYVGQQ